MTTTRRAVLDFTCTGPPNVGHPRTPIGWARAQAASLTEYFVSIGRIDPDETLDGAWPIR